MTPADLETRINNTYGDGTLTIDRDGGNVRLRFRGGEPTAYAKRAVQELVGHNSNWTPEGHSESSTELVYTYTGDQ